MAGFSFKQFHIEHDQCAMKVGTDGILLGAWCELSGCQQILDVGTGSGLIALMLAQRSKAHCRITAVEIDPHAAVQAAANVARTDWAKRVEVIESSVQDYAAQTDIRFDLMVSNPPFYPSGQELKTQARATARHCAELAHEVLLTTAQQLLTATGRLALVLPTLQAQALLQKAQALGWCCKRRLAVSSKPNAEPMRWLLELQRQPVATEQLALTIHQPNGEYSADYVALTRAFYLKMAD